MSDSASVLNNKIEIADPADENVKYEFKVPGIKDQMALGMRARAIRRQNDPTGSGDLFGLDQDTAMLAWSLAAFEILLTGSGAKWPYSAGPDNKPVVDYVQFPEDKFDTILMVGYKLDQEIARFRKGWTSNWKQTGAETLAGGDNSGA